MVGLASEQMRDVAFAFPLDVGPGPVQGSSQATALQLGLLQVSIQREDQIAESGVLVGQMCPIGLVELSGQIGDARNVDDGPNLGQGRRSKSRPRGRGYCAVLSALAEGKVSIPVSLSR